MGKAVITTHVLDLDNGYPAANIAVTLAHPSGRSFSGTTNDDGRIDEWSGDCLLYTSPSPRDRQKSRMPSSA